MDWTLTLILGLVIILFLYWKVLSDMNYWKKRGVPYVKPIPVFGNALDTVLLRASIYGCISNLYRQLDGEKYGGFLLFSKPVLLLRDRELINQILIKDFAHFHDRGEPQDAKHQPLDANLVNLTGNDWRQVRHKLTPTFTSSKLKMMFHDIEKCSEDAINYLQNKEAIEVKNYSQKFVLNVIGLVAFGLNIDALNEKSEESKTFLENCTKTFAPSGKTVIKFIILRMLPKLARILKIQFMDLELQEFFMKLVKDTIEHREKTGLRKNDFIQLMLELKKQENSSTVDERFLSNDLEEEDMELLNQLKNSPIQYDAPVFTDNCIAAQSFLFITGGSETTANTLAFTMYELGMNPKLQDRLRKEIDSILSSREFDYQAVKDMVYLDQFIYEVLRLHPPLAVMFRNCTKDFLIPGTDHVIEKHVAVAIPIAELHKNPEYFPEPDKFDPDRFIDLKAFPKGVFLPFGDGPRICIAKRLALLEMKIFLAKLLSKFKLIVSEKTQLPLKMNHRALIPNVVGGIWIHFEKRE